MIFGEKQYTGIANPSGAIALDDTRFIVADDEDNLLRIYDKAITAHPVQMIALKDIFSGEIIDGEDMEIDIEGAAELNGLYFWIGSHSASRKGKLRPARHRLFALHIKQDGTEQYTAAPAGKIYTTLIADLMQDSRFENYGFEKAQTIEPKTIGGLSIEGLASTPENSLLIGFRNPLSGGKTKDGRLVEGKALLVPLLNPFEIILGLTAKFGDPIELDLNGHGIRDIVFRKKQKFLIAAGPYHDNTATQKHDIEQTQLYSWSYKSKKLKHLKKIKLDNLNIEAAFFYPGNNEYVQLFSDDGKQAQENKFRSLSLKIV